MIDVFRCEMAVDANVASLDRTQAQFRANLFCFRAPPQFLKRRKVRRSLPALHFIGVALGTRFGGHHLVRITAHDLAAKRLRVTEQHCRQANRPKEERLAQSDVSNWQSVGHGLVGHRFAVTFGRYFWMNDLLTREIKRPIPEVRWVGQCKQDNGLVRNQCVRRSNTRHLH